MLERLSGFRTMGPVAAGKLQATPSCVDMLCRFPCSEVPSNICSTPGAGAANAETRVNMRAAKNLPFIDGKKTVIESERKERTGGGERRAELTVPTAFRTLGGAEAFDVAQI